MLKGYKNLESKSWYGYLGCGQKGAKLKNRRWRLTDETQEFFRRITFVPWGLSQVLSPAGYTAAEDFSREIVLVGKTYELLGQNIKPSWPLCVCVCVGEREKERERDCLYHYITWKSKRQNVNTIMLRRNYCAWGTNTKKLIVEEGKNWRSYGFCRLLPSLFRSGAEIAFWFL